jgi:hypothetical protein
LVQIPWKKLKNKFIYEKLMIIKDLIDIPCEILNEWHCYKYKKNIKPQLKYYGVGEVLKI